MRNLFTRRDLIPVSRFYVVGLFLEAMVFCNAAVAAEICVAGAGDSEWDGSYNNNSAANLYMKDSSHYLYSDTFNWGFYANSSGMGSPAYATATNAGPDGNTFMQVLGMAPAPTVTSGACTTSTTTTTTTTTTSTTLVPTPTPTPTVTDPLPEYICFLESDDTSKSYSGTYHLTSGSSKTQAYKYVSEKDSKLTIEPDDLNGVIDSELRSDGRTKYSNRYIENYNYNKIPLGTYRSWIKVPGTSNPCCPSDERTASVSLTEGRCAASDGVTISIPTTTITGKVVTSSASQKRGALSSVPELMPGVIYAVLFDGLTKEESTTKTPVGFAVTNSEGTYTFQDVVPGEYHIVFVGLDAVFTPSQVSVAVVGNAPATAADATVKTVTYADEGCTTTSISGDIAAVNQEFVSYYNTVRSQFKLAGDLARQYGKGKSLAKLNKEIASSESRVDSVYGTILELAAGFPVNIRTKCAASSNCPKRSLQGKKSSLTSLLKQISNAEAKVLKSAEAVLAKRKKELNLLKKGTKSVQRALKLCLRAAEKLPSTHEACAVVE